MMCFTFNFLVSLFCHFSFSYQYYSIVLQESPGDARVTRECAINHSKMAVGCHLGYYWTGNSAIRSAEPENPCLELDIEWIGCTVCKIFAFKLYCDLETGIRGHSRSLKVTPLDRPTPENIMLEPNITSIGKAVVMLWLFLNIQDGHQPPSWI